MSISVIITTHDAYDKWINRAVKSVLNQSYQEFEIIVVKDGGKNIKKDLPKDKRIRYIHAKKFGAHPRPKNIGTLAAKYDLIAYLDADNEFRKDHLMALSKALTPSLDVVYGDRMMIDEKNNKKQPGDHHDFSLHLLSQKPYIDTNDVLCRKSAILAVGGWDESLKYFADYNLWCRMAKNGSQFKRVPIILTDYYVHGDNNVNKSRQKYEELIKKGVDPQSPQFIDLLNGFSIQNCYLWPDKTLVGKRPKLKVAIFTLTYNRCSYTQETFSSMRELTNYPFDHFVLDQGSDDGTWNYLCDYEKKYNLKIFTENKNLGISRGSNYLLDKIGSDYDIIIKVDNDIRFMTKDWLETIVGVFERSKGIIVSPYIEGLIDHPGGWPRIKDGYIGKEYIGIVQHLGGACIAAPYEVYEGFRWQENDFLHGEQDWVFSQHVMESGRVLAYLENVRVEHMFDTSSGANPDNEADKEYLRKRKIEKVTRFEE